MATSTHVFTPLHPSSRTLGDLRALALVVKKEWLHIRRYPTWIIQLIVWPVIFPLGYVLSARALSGPDGSGLALFTQRTGISDYLGFIAVGTTIWMIQNVTLWGLGFALRNEQMRGVLESNWMTPTWRFSFLLGPAIVHLGQMLTFVVVSSIEFGLIFGVRYHGNPLLAVLLILASMPSIYGLGMAFASLVITAKEGGQLVQLVRGLVMIFCGITFPTAIMPGWMQAVARWLPQTYSIHGIRAAALANASFADLVPDLLALLGFGVFWLVVGYVVFILMERRARQTGAIGQY